MERNEISRNSSSNFSSRSIYYCRKSEGIPFQWESEPGIPKHPSPQEILPPLSPPPAILSMGLPKPCIGQPKPLSRIRLRFWKKSKDSKRSVQTPTLVNSNDDPFSCIDKLDTFSFFNSDFEFMSSPNCYSTSSSSSSSSPSFVNESLDGRNLETVSFGRPSSCSIWQIKRILVCRRC